MRLGLKDVIVQDLWVHLAALLALAIGVVAWFVRSHFGQDPSSLELMFMIGGLAGMGLKIVNGSAAQLRQTALDATYAASRAAQLVEAAAQSVAIPPPPASGS